MNKEDLIEYKKKIAELSEKEKKLRDLELKKYATGELQGPPVGYASIDKPWLKYYPESINDIQIPNQSIYQLLEQNSQKMLDKPVIRYFGFKTNFRDYLKRINKIAISLKKIGVKQGDIVPLVLPNVPECRELIYALNMIGAISYPLNPLISPQVFDQIMRENKISKLFIFSGLYPKYKDKIESNSDLQEVVLLNGDESLPSFLRKTMQFKDKLKKEEKPNYLYRKENISWDEFYSLSKGVKGKIDSVFVPNQTAIIIGTSGTTGTPKGVCLTNESLNAMTLQHMYGDMNIEEGDLLLDTMMQSISYGLAVTLYSANCGLETIIIPELNTHILPLLRKYKPQHYTGGPVHYENILKDLGNQPIDLPPQKNMVSGGATLDKKVESKLNNCAMTEDDGDIYVRQGLGCTENGGASTFAKKGTYKFGGVGIPLALENMGVFIPGTEEEVLTGQTGELCITGPTLMTEYFNNKAETENVLKTHSDGTLWLHMGDLGHIDEDGQVYITDRIKEIFMRNCFNVHPSTIAKKILEHPGVDSCKVIGVEHPIDQMVPLAFIKLKEGYDLEGTKYEIEEMCKEGLEETSIPFEYVFVDYMPINLGGKIDTKQLLDASGIDYMKNNNVKELKLVHVEAFKK